SFDAALLDEGDGVLKIVVSILRAVRRKDSPRKIWFAVDCFDYTHLVGADFDQRYRPAEESLGERVKKVQAGLEHVSLDADFAFGGHHASRRHAAAEITAFLNRNFARADVHKNSSQDYDQHNQRDNGDKQDRHYCHWIDVIHVTSYLMRLAGSVMGWRSPLLPVRGGRLRGSASGQNLRLSFLSAKRVSKTLPQIKTEAQQASPRLTFLHAKAEAHPRSILDIVPHHHSMRRSAKPSQCGSDPGQPSRTRSSLSPLVRSPATRFGRCATRAKSI